MVSSPVVGRDVLEEMEERIFITTTRETEVASSYTDLRVGDLVLVLDELSTRNTWPMGLVKEVYEGSDGLVRSVKLRVRGSSLVRPVVKLVRLEC